MSHSRYAKFALLGIASGFLMSSQQLAADTNEENDKSANFLAAASCRGPNGCGAMQTRYNHQTADNLDDRYNQGTSTYYNTNPSNPSANYSTSNTYPSQSTPSNTDSTNSYYNQTPSTTKPNGYTETNPTNSYYNTGSSTQNSNYNRNLNPSQPTNSNSQYNQYQDQPRTNRYLAAEDSSKEENFIA